MKILLISTLITMSCIASAEVEVLAEKLITYGNPAQVSLGYQRCAVVLNMIGNASIQDYPNEGAELVASANRFSKLFEKTVDLRTKGKKDEIQATKIRLIKMYEINVAPYDNRPKSDIEQSLFFKDITFCKKWVDNL